MKKEMASWNLSAAAKSILFLFFTITLCSGSSAQIREGFETGFQSWIRKGDPSQIRLDISNAHSGNYCAKLTGHGSIFQKIPVKGFSILQYELFLKSSSKAFRAHSFLRFYGDGDHPLLEYTGSPVASTVYVKTGDYTEAPPGTRYVTVGVETNDADTGSVYVDDLSVQLNIGEPTDNHIPECNLDQYMEPFWKTDTVYNETILLYSSLGQPASGKLLFSPDKILSVQRFDLKRNYVQGKDYFLSGNQITRAPGSTMPYRADTSFDYKNDLAWYNLQSEWVVVTYSHKERWNGPTPAYKGDYLPEVMSRLKSGSPIRIVAYGMSLTRGLNVSGYDTVSPYMPGYVDLFTRELKKQYPKSEIRLFNAGLPGARVDWGASYADRYINPVHPDLVIIDFGMNDFWKYSPEEFRMFIKRIIETVKASNPRTEFLLLSNMKFDPDYVLDTDKYKSFYTGNLAGYQVVLHQLEGKGIAEVDMTNLSSAIYQIKKAKDCISNPLHANDYMARWYAQAMIATLSRQ